MALDRIVQELKNKARHQRGDHFKDRTIASLRQRTIRSSASHEQNLLERLKTERKYRTGDTLETPKPDRYSTALIITQIKNQHKKQVVDPSLDISQISDDYQVFVNDGSIKNPFAISPQLVQIIKRHTRTARTDEEKARAIYDWIEANIQYGDSRRLYGYSNSTEVLQNQQGVCGEMAFLYITMARSVNLRASYVSVTRDCHRKKVHHACAMVHTLSRDIMVDPAYHTFGIEHKEYKVLTDMDVLERFNQWR